MKLEAALKDTKSRVVNILVRNQRIPRIEGYPPGIDFQTINDVCQKYTNNTLQSISYSHISSWKKAGSYRLHIKTANECSWSLIFKNAIYEGGYSPALAGLPVAPGPPEYLIYSNLSGDLLQYLPKVYSCNEEIAGKHYKYLLEDLNNEYEKSFNTKNILSLVSELPRLHNIIGNWAKTIYPNSLLLYDYQFSERLIAYVKKNLHLSIEMNDGLNKYVKKVLHILPEIEPIIVKQRHNIELCRLQPIHGDFNPSNILTHKNTPCRIKLLDWEWAGLGVPHADLASLLARVSSEVEKEALLIFSKLHSNLSLTDHQDIYYQKKMERHLLDAAFLVAQQIKSGKNFSRIIETSLQRIINSFEEQR